MLWLSLHLPQLPLEVFSRGWASCEPMAVVEGGHGRARVSVANRAARKGGAHVGLSAAAAQALVDGLRLFRRDPRKESEALAGLATWAGQFTSQVSLEADGLLLEIASSLRLFGGLEKLVGKVCRGIRALGYQALPAVAPTPLAASWLARAGQAAMITERADLAERLARLPLALLDGEAAHHDMLAAMGLTTLGDCLALPRAGLRRRFGEALLNQIDRALGLLPDPREAFQPPAQFASRLELPAEVHDSAALSFASRRLIHELEGFLRARDAAIQRFHLDLLHGEAPATRVTVGLASPGRDGQRLFGLLRERLERLALPQPVGGIVLTAEHILPHQACTLELFPDARREAHGMAPLIERLRARLGDGMVYALECVADHRPEQAMQVSEPGRGRERIFAPCRPCWLLPRPRPLHCRDGVPHLGGALILDRGPERIESGWWDGHPVARDYFVASSPGGSRYWVYREAGGEWFLHGIFA